MEREEAGIKGRSEILRAYLFCPDSCDTVVFGTHTYVRALVILEVFCTCAPGENCAGMGLATSTYSQFYIIYRSLVVHKLEVVDLV